MRLVCAVALALALLTPAPAWAQLSKETSEVTNATRLVSADMRPLVTESYPGHASFRAEYEMTSTDTTWGLSFYGFAKQSTDMSTATEVQMQVDGQPISARSVQSDTRSLDGSILEITHATFDRSSYERMATADRVGAVIGSYRFTLTRPVRKDLRLILDWGLENRGQDRRYSVE